MRILKQAPEEYDVVRDDSKIPLASVFIVGGKHFMRPCWGSHFYPTGEELIEIGNLMLSLDRGESPE